MNSPTEASITKFKHPIKVVARRTGLSTDVIRVWERRYKAVTPIRSSSARRLYCDADIERLILLHRVTQAGRRIADVASMATEDLAAMATGDLSALRTEATVEKSALEHFHNALRAVREMNAVSLDAILRHAATALSLPTLLDEVIAPLIHTIGEEWSHGSLRVGHEHLATAQLVTLLGELRRTSNIAQSAPKVLVATPAGQSHELGALLAAVAASAEGWNAIYLSPNAPAADIAAAVRQTEAQALALSIAYPADDPYLADELRRLRQQLPEGVAILVGGRAIAGYRAALKEIDAVCLDTLPAFRQALGELRRLSLR
jgi:DNA-binding transcriptional MerR regulator/methylmalonyl-CoA mutase cobalamin-binding subunit